MSNPKLIGDQTEHWIHEYCKNHGLHILARNYKLRGIECDLIIKSPNQEIWLLEVKTLKYNCYLERRVSPSQIQRIRAALGYLILMYPNHTVRAHLVTVSKDQTIQWYYDFFIL